MRSPHGELSPLAALAATCSFEAVRHASAMVGRIRIKRPGAVSPPKTDLPNRRNGASEPEGQLIPRPLGGSLARPMVLVSDPNQIVLVGSWKNM